MARCDFPRRGFDRHSVWPLSEAATTQIETANDHSYKPETTSLSPRGAAVCGAVRPRRYRCTTPPARTRPGSTESAGHGADGLRARVLNGVHRCDRAARCNAEIACRSRCGPCLRSMGTQRLYVGAGLADIDRWRPRRCLWKGAYARARLLPVRSGVRGLRAGAFSRLADRCPRRARRGSSDRHPRQPRPDRGHLSARRAESGDRHMGRGIGAYYRRRSCLGRLADRDLWLAIRVLDQPADRGRSSRNCAGLRA
ncbi:hypothetical protein EDE08_11774 [Bradyrhizobium sp. R2.2-H]|nr:hypothetical protein EDE08_11774 [Bradyrhizobium sp. R2.2-H]